jgi:ubiquinone/menaquinone biosynthesis C-methylase UbiE
MNDRQERIVHDLQVKPTDRVLEIGCGQGVAGTFICEQLTTGSYTGIDRSQKMIDAATKRNQRFVSEGKAQFLMQELEELNLGVQQFDKILAVRVRLFHTEPDHARQIIEKYLAPHGSITVIYDTPS